MSVREGTPCSCGSGQPRQALYDGNGFFCSYYCAQCEQKVRSRSRPEILNRAYNANDVDEDIWGDE
jgi:hypothetical protein